MGDSLSYLDNLLYTTNTITIPNIDGVELNILSGLKINQFS